MTEYCKARPEDLEEIIDLMNYTFSSDHEPHDFKKILPKMYDDKYDYSNEHFIVRENNKIRACLALHKSEQRVGNEVLKLGGIGMVTVHPYHRGKGYMKKLMVEAVNDMNKTCDLGFLGGQRQRYSYFGFEPAGMDTIFTVTPTNIKHAYKDILSEDIYFNELNKNDLDLIKKCHELHEKQVFTGVREFENFFDIMKSWGSSLYSISKKDEFIGYISYNNGNICEIRLCDENLYKPVIKGFFEQVAKNECTFYVDLFNKKLISCLSDICENYKISHSYNSFMLCNTKKVIQAYLSLKSQSSKLLDGKIVLKIDDDILEIKVINGKVSIENTTEDPLISFTKIEALQNLFTPLCGVIGKSIDLPTFAKEWFPLGLYIHSIDGC